MPTFTKVFAVILSACIGALLVSCGQHAPTGKFNNETMIITDTSKKQILRLELILAKNKVKTGENTQAEIILSNQSDSSFWVCKWMGIGYHAADGRVYCEIYQADNSRYYGYQSWQIDYNPAQRRKKDFRLLEPGEQVTSSFDLQEWYRLVDPGEYQIKVGYSPQPFDSVPDLYLTPVMSERVTITVIP